MHTRSRMFYFTPPSVANGDIKENYNNSQRLGGAHGWCVSPILLFMHKPE